MAHARSGGQSGRTGTTKTRLSTSPDRTVAVADPVTVAKQQSQEPGLEPRCTWTGPGPFSRSATPVPARASHGPWLWLALLGLGLLSAFNAWNAYRLTKLPIIELRMVTAW